MNYENQNQLDDEVINNFSNVYNIENNRKSTYKKVNSENAQNINITKAKFTDEEDSDDEAINNISNAFNIENNRKRHTKKKANSENSHNYNITKTKFTDVDNSDDYDQKNSKEEEKRFKKEYEKVIKKLMENNDYVKYIKEFTIFDESKIKCFEDILNLNKKRYRSTDN